MSANTTTRRPVPSGSSRVAAPDRRKQYRRRARIADALVTALWASGAAAAALFLATGGAAKFGTAADAVTSLGIVTGLIGTDFVLVMIVLAARIPVIDRTVGHDRAIAVHRSLGKPALYLLLAHGLLLLVGYGMSSGFNPIAEIGPMLAIPDMPLAFVGLGLLIVVVITSLVAVRRKFSYEGWHIVHLLSYVAVLVAVPHQLSVGGILAAGSVERVYWIALYVLAFGSIATYRFAEPVISTFRHRLRVSRVETVAPGVVSIHFSGRNLRSLESAGGQFFVWRFWTGRTWWHSHPISLSSVPTDASARITVRDLGTGSSAISSVRPGTRVSFEGPYGMFTDAGRTAPKLAIVVAGIGITPVRAFLEDSRVRPGETTILLRASTQDETYLWNEISELAAKKGARLYTMVGKRARSGPGWMPQPDASRGVTLKSVFPDLADSDLYICGPTAWLDLVENDARRAGIPEHQLHTERFDW
ncbi:oxidoreductase [Glaciihabitans sp. INWT7]|uniref:ferredoxin reductase family protein n=1 Tax=Glaciihabitans sp. INWT7 TaxID=2596912 RepID=UPI00162840F4|nr:ferredoxin reductase family protein [Glaciihabitans sp. INWT7]QNE46730.1 oxidoreductase [Glaciihabitans sp. INWT7]